MNLIRFKGSLALATVIAASAALAAIALANPMDKVIAKKSARGRQAMAVVVVDTAGNGLTHYSLRITASPNQRVKAGWARACTNGYPGPRDAKTFVAKTPVTRKIKDIDPMWYGWACKLEGDARLTGRGHVTVQLIQS
jgi:hypothetical protein